MVNNIKLADEQVEEILSNANLKLVSGEYVNARTKIHVVDESGYQAFATLVALKNGISNVAKFHQDNPYVIDNLKIHFEKIGATITPINFYIKDKRAQLEAVCKNGHTFHTKWRIGSNYANTCPECIDIPLYNIEDVKAEISEISPNIIIHSDVCKNANSKLDIECSTCGHNWKMTYSNMKLGKNCPKCAKAKLGIERAPSIDSIKARMYKINKNITILDNDYKNNRVKLNCVCDKGHEWQANWNNLRSGKGCPSCNASKLEKVIVDYLEENKVFYEPQKTFKDCRDIKVLRFDFYIPKLNLCIEADGEQHFRSVDWFGGEEKFKRQKQRDSIKNEFCKSNDIGLLRIRYDEIDFIPQILEENVLTKL